MIMIMQKSYIQAMGVFVRLCLMSESTSECLVSDDRLS